MDERNPGYLVLPVWELGDLGDDGADSSVLSGTDEAI